MELPFCVYFAAKPPMGGRSSLPRRKPRFDARGFTIAEVMMASFVMIFGIASAIIVMQSGLRALDTARNTTLASQLIQSEMERIRLLSWSGVNALPASAAIEIGEILPTDLPSISELRSRFTITREVSDVSGKVGDMKEIDIIVSWRGVDGQTHVRSSSTHYSREGLYAYYYTKART